MAECKVNQDETHCRKSNWRQILKDVDFKLETMLNTGLQSQKYCIYSLKSDQPPEILKNQVQIVSPERHKKAHCSTDDGGKGVYRSGATYNVMSFIVY